jgi:hypothetical protein
MQTSWRMLTQTSTSDPISRFSKHEMCEIATGLTAHRCTIHFIYTYIHIYMIIYISVEGVYSKILIENMVQ